jgi:hypothetical protein
MATMREKRRCEADTRTFLNRHDLPQPDRVEYGHTCIRMFYDEQKVCLIIDIDEPPPGFERVEEELF